MRDTGPRYEFYEKVVVCAPCRRVHQRLGAVLGRVQREGDEGWNYAVHIYDEAVVWSLREEELLPTGEFDVRETFYDGTVVEVEVDAEGHGRIRGPVE